MIGPIRALKSWREQQKFKAFYREFISAGDLCFDIGANRGHRTRIFRRLDATVVSVEPVLSTFEILKTRFSSDLRVHPIHAAVGAESGTGTIHVSSVDEVSTLSSSFMTAYAGQDMNISWHRQEEITLISLQDLIEEHGVPSFCKIDVEGYEPEVMSGLIQPIPALSFEYNARLKEKAFLCLDHLGRWGDAQYNFSPYETLQFSCDGWLDLDTFKGYLLNLPEQVLTGDVYVRMA